METAAVECRLQPRLLVNPDFVDTWAATPEKLLMLVMHELHHVLLGHTRLFPRATRVDNLVFDAIINCAVVPHVSRPGTHHVLHGLLRRQPFSRLPSAATGRLDARPGRSPSRRRSKGGRCAS